MKYLIILLLVSSDMQIASVSSACRPNVGVIFDSTLSMSDYVSIFISKSCSFIYVISDVFVIL
jgi:hypothetical protein